MVISNLIWTVGDFYAFLYCGWFNKLLLVIVFVQICLLKCYDLLQFFYT